MVLRGGAFSHERGTPVLTLPHPTSPCVFISHKVLLKSFCRSQLRYKSVNSSFTITNIKNRFTDLCGIDFFKTTLKTLCERSVWWWRPAEMPGPHVRKESGERASRVQG